MVQGRFLWFFKAPGWFFMFVTTIVVMMMMMVVVVVGVLHVRPAGRWPLQDFIKTDFVSPGKRKSPFDELVEF